MLRRLDQSIIAANRAWDRLDMLVQFPLLVLMALPFIMLPSLIARSYPLALAAIVWTAGIMVFRIYGHLRPKRA